MLLRPYTISFLMLVLSFFQSSNVCAITGAEIAKMVYDRPDGSSSQAIWHVQLLKDGTLLEDRETITLAQDVSENASNRVIKFTKPPLIRGTALLFLEDESGEETTYLYLPSLHKERRISSSQKDKRFANTEFTFEDFERREVDLDSHTFLGEKQEDGFSCYVIESIPLDLSSTAYTKRVSWIDKSSLLPVKINFFGKSGKLEKVLSNKNIKKYGSYWTATLSSMKNLETQKETIMNLLEIKYDEEIASSNFHQKRFGEM